MLGVHLPIVGRSLRAIGLLKVLILLGVGLTGCGGSDKETFKVDRTAEGLQRKNELDARLATNESKSYGAYSNKTDAELKRFNESNVASSSAQAAGYNSKTDTQAKEQFAQGALFLGALGLLTGKIDLGLGDILPGGSSDEDAKDKEKKNSKETDQPPNAADPQAGASDTPASAGAVRTRQRSVTLDDQGRSLELSVRTEEQCNEGRSTNADLPSEITEMTEAAKREVARASGQTGESGERGQP